MAVVDYGDLKAIRSQNPDRKIVFVSGSFDLTHAGHVRFFEECKKLGDVLVVSVGKDEDIRKHKGETRPVLSEKVRLKMVDSLKPVDYAFLNNSQKEGEDWIEPLREVFELLEPDLYVVNYDGGSMERRQEVAALTGVKFLVLDLTREHPDQFEGISTSGIIDKIRNA